MASRLSWTRHRQSFAGSQKVHSDGGEGNSRPADLDRVQVLVRVRPLVARELLEDEYVEVLGEETVHVTRGTVRFESRYDHVFDKDSSQRDVYMRTQELVDAVLQGYNATIFAYGQTGTGKTYTMLGAQYTGGRQSQIAAEMIAPEASSKKRRESADDGINGASSSEGQSNADADADADGENADMEELHPGTGIIPRAIADVFSRLKAVTSASSEAEATVQCSYMEIYNEQLYDLLEPYKPVTNSRNALALDLGRRRSGLEMREDTDSGGTRVIGLREVPVTSTSTVLELIRRGNKNRSVRQTEMNEHSSRSHTILQLRVEQFGVGDGTQSMRLRSKLSLVDLAGSERWSADAAMEGARVSEMTSINQSLSALTTVIASLSDPNRTHIPYRDSKLTYLLQDSLGSNCRTAIIATVSPSALAYDETISTLKFADRAIMVVNHPKVTVEVDNDTRREKELQRLKGLLALYAKQDGGASAVEMLDEKMRALETDNQQLKATLSETRDALRSERIRRKQLASILSSSSSSNTTLPVRRSGGEAPQLLPMPEGLPQVPVDGPSGIGANFEETPTSKPAITREFRDSGDGRSEGHRSRRLSGGKRLSSGEGSLKSRGKEKERRAEMGGSGQSWEGKGSGKSRASYDRSNSQVRAEKQGKEQYVQRSEALRQKGSSGAGGILDGLSPWGGSGNLSVGGAGAQAESATAPAAAQKHRAVAKVYEGAVPQMRQKGLGGQRMMMTQGHGQLMAERNWHGSSGGQGRISLQDTQILAENAGLGPGVSQIHRSRAAAAAAEAWGNPSADGSLQKELSERALERYRQMVIRQRPSPPRPTAEGMGEVRGVGAHGLQAHLASGHPGPMEAWTGPSGVESSSTGVSQTGPLRGPAGSTYSSGKNGLAAAAQSDWSRADEVGPVTQGLMNGLGPMEAYLAAQARRKAGPAAADWPAGREGGKSFQNLEHLGTGPQDLAASMVPERTGEAYAIRDAPGNARPRTNPHDRVAGSFVSRHSNGSVTALPERENRQLGGMPTGDVLRTGLGVGYLRNGDQFQHRVDGGRGHPMPREGWGEPVLHSGIDGPPFPTSMQASLRRGVDPVYGGKVPVWEDGSGSARDSGYAEWKGPGPQAGTRAILGGGHVPMYSSGQLRTVCEQENRDGRREGSEWVPLARSSVEGGPYMRVQKSTQEEGQSGTRWGRSSLKGSNMGIGEDDSPNFSWHRGEQVGCQILLRANSTHRSAVGGYGWNGGHAPYDVAETSSYPERGPILYPMQKQNLGPYAHVGQVTWSNSTHPAEAHFLSDRGLQIGNVKGSKQGSRSLRGERRGQISILENPPGKGSMIYIMGTMSSSLKAKQLAQMARQERVYHRQP